MDKQIDHLVDGKYSIQDLVDMDRLRKIFQMFTESTGFTIGFLDHPDLNILIATGWREICTKYHRHCPIAAKNCFESNKHLLGQLTLPGKIVIEACENGLVECATPIIIKGKHIASLATGQLFLKAPDIDLFRQQARLFGIDETLYLEALKEIPVVSELKLKSITGLLGEIAFIISELGHANLEVREEAARLDQEIALRIRGEEALRESEETFRSLFESSKDGIVLLSDELDLMMVNAAFAQMHGYSLDEIRRMSLKDLDTPGTFLLAPERLQRCLSGEVLNFEAEHYCKNGQTILLEVVVNLVTIQGRRCILGVHRDITARKRAEEDLEESERNARLFVEHTPAAIAMMDNNMNYIIVSHRWMTDYGLKDANIIGCNHYDVFPEIPARWKEIHQRCLKGAVEKCEADPFVRTDGNIDWIRWEIWPWKKKGGGIGGLVMFTEVITDRKKAEEALQESEERYRRLLASMTDYIYSVRVDNGRAVETVHGPGCAVVTGRTSEEYKENPDLWYQMVYPDDRAEVLSMAERALNGGSVEPLEHRIYRKDGSICWLRDTVVVRKDDAGRVVSYDGLVTDVTERKRVEEAMRESEERYRHLFERASVGIILLTMDGKIFSVNEAYARAHGYTATEMLGMKPEDLDTPESAKLFPDRLRRILSGDSMTFEVENYHKDGHVVLFEVSASRIMLGGIFYFQAFVHDITGRKKTEERIRMLSAVVEQSTEGMAIANLEGQFLFLNEAWCNMHGYKEARQLLGQNLAIGHNQEQIEKDVVPFNKKVFEFGAYSGEVGHITMDGKPFPTLMTVILLKDDEGAPYAFAAIAVEISERKKIENELKEYREHLEDIVRRRTGELTDVNNRLMGEIVEHRKTEAALENSRSYLDKIINSIPDPIFVKDREHKFVLMNDVVCALMGRKREELIGRSDYEFFPKDQADVFWTKDEEVFSSGKENLNEEFFSDGTGIVRTIMTKKTLYVDGDGNKFIVGVIRDMTEIKQATEQLVAAQARMVQAEKMASLGQLVSGIAHEINNPCGYVLSNLDMLKQYEKNLAEYWSAVRKADHMAGKSLLDIEEKLNVKAILKDMPHLVAESVDGAQRIARIVEDLRMFSHPEGGNWELRDIHQTLKRALNIVIAELKNRIEVVSQYGELPLVFMKEQQIVQVFINLLTNAAQSIQGPGTVTIKTYVLHKDVYVEISDTGKGIAQEDMGRIFDPFYTTKPVGQGTGLGLSVVHGIVERHRGTVTVRSNLGVGSTFIVRLPIDATVQKIRKKGSSVH